MVVLIAASGCARGLSGPSLSTFGSSIETIVPLSEGGQVGEPSETSSTPYSTGYSSTYSSSGSYDSGTTTTTTNALEIWSGPAVLAGLGPRDQIEVALDCASLGIGPGDVDGDGVPDVGVR